MIKVQGFVFLREADDGGSGISGIPLKECARSCFPEHRGHQIAENRFFCLQLKDFLTKKVFRSKELPFSFFLRVCSQVFCYLVFCSLSLLMYTFTSFLSSSFLFGAIPACFEVYLHITLSWRIIFASVPVWRPVFMRRFNLLDPLKCSSHAHQLNPPVTVI